MSDFEIGGVRVSLSYITFPDNTIPKGLLPRDRGAQALWYYYILCERQKHIVGDGPESQIIVHDIHHHEPWYNHHYMQTARSVALMYEVTVEEMYSYWPVVKKEIQRMGFPEPDPRYESPRRFMV